jgi:hypothetical protein
MKRKLLSLILVVSLVCGFVVPVTAEFAPVNETLFVYEINVSENWLEITNSTDISLSTKGMYLSQYASRCIGSGCNNCTVLSFCDWQMPSVIINPSLH